MNWHFLSKWNSHSTSRHYTRCKIEPTINGIINGKDELLEKAIEIIKNETTKH